jgi:hypothetical protein
VAESLQELFIDRNSPEAGPSTSLIDQSLL